MSLQIYFTPYSDMTFLLLNIIFGVYIDCYIPSHVWDLSVVLIFLPLCSHFDIQVIYTSFVKWFRTPLVLLCALEQFRKCFILQNTKKFDKTVWSWTFTKGNSVSFSGNFFQVHSWFLFQWSFSLLGSSWLILFF